MKIVVDTNIIFSALLNATNSIGEILFRSDKRFEFYSCNYMRYEIQKHWNKLKKISGLTDSQLQTSYLQVLSKIRFINEELIPPEIWNASEPVANSIDIDDIDSIALALFLKATLWTGDKILYAGLSKIDFIPVLNTSELLALRISKTNS